MPTKKKDRNTGRNAVGLFKEAKTFVTFQNGHMQLDVKGFLSSREGRESVQQVIRQSKSIPQSNRDKEKPEPAAAA
jgi:hypothetical protein